MFIEPAVAGDTVFVGSCSGAYFALDAATGEVRWHYETSSDGTSAQFHGDALVTEELVMVGSDARPTGHLYAFERSGGAVRWKHPFPFGVGVDLRRFGSTVLAASMNGEVGAFDLATGAPIWLHDSGLDVSGKAPVDPLLIDDDYYVPWRSGHLDAYDAASGHRQWRRTLPAPANTSVLNVGDDLVVGTEGGDLLRLSRQNGQTLAQLHLGAHVYGELVDTGDCLLSLTAPAPGENGQRHALVCVEPNLSGERWRHTIVREGDISTFTPFVRGDEVIVGVRDRLIALALADGSVRWEAAIDGLPRGLNSSPTLFYVGTFSGTVWAYPWLQE